MCKVILKANNENIDFIIYNLIFESDMYCFTTDYLWKKIRRYDEQISKRMVQIKIDALINDGLILQEVGGYCTTI